MFWQAPLSFRFQTQIILHLSSWQKGTNENILALCDVVGSGILPIGSGRTRGLERLFIINLREPWREWVSTRKTSMEMGGAAQRPKMFGHVKYHGPSVPLPYLNSRKPEFLIYVFYGQELEGHIKEKFLFLLFSS